jgi:Tfp pilus assembly protein PilV
MVELLCAMGVMSIGVMAVYAMFESSTVQIKRASTVSTAAALAGGEMESFRAVKYETIGLAETDVSAADAAYTGDAAFRAVSSPVNQTDSTVVLTKCPATPCTNTVPTRNVTGADGKSYRVDTYVTWQTVTNSAGTAGRNVKLITIVVRDATTARPYARISSAFDESTGL